jgi:hypothetical protein
MGNTFVLLARQHINKYFALAQNSMIGYGPPVGDSIPRMSN